MANTTAPLTEVDVANMAATTLDEGELTSLDDHGTLGSFMRTNFGPARDELLYSQLWAFAKAQEWLAEHSEPPKFGYSRRFRLPSDCVRPLPLREGGRHNGRPINFERFGDFIHTDARGPLPLVYIRRETNPAWWSPPFARCLGQYLALLAAQRITGKAGYVDKAERLFNLAMQNAVMNNALDYGTPESQYREDVHDVRLGG